MKLYEITDWIETKAPLQLQEDYDNSGLIVGDRNQEVVRVLVCLDMSEKTMAFARDHGADLVISHHPGLFKPIKVVSPETMEGSLLYAAIKGDIALYSAHTNFDSVKGGMTDILCEALGLSAVKVLKPASFDAPENGFGRVGSLKSAMEAKDFIKLLSAILGVNTVRSVGKAPKEIRRVAVYNGSFDRTILKQLKAIAPDVLLTGDLKYHDALELDYHRIYTIDAGHYGTEILFVKAFARMLQESFKDLEILTFEGEDVFQVHTSID
jgi:dinuclear metal center YbgI/SA1388 family protein